MIIQRLLWTVLFCFPILISLSAQEFPASWEGNWSGGLEIYRYNSIVDTVPMALSIEKISEDRWTFTILYGAGDNMQKRPYELVRLGEANGLYQIDEKNGIVLDAFYHDPCLYERFTVAGNMLTTQICKQGEALHYEITFGGEEPYAFSGDTVLNQSDTIPEVKSYSIPNIQRAMLYRQ